MPFRTIIVVILAVVALSSCGRRGPLEEPGAAPANGEAIAPGAGTSPLDPGAPAVIPEPARAQAPERRFFLDFLL